MTSKDKPNYGLDAPELAHFFFIAGATALSIFLIVLFVSIVTPLKILLVVSLGIAATYLLGMGCFMIYGSKVMKLKDRDELLNLVPWSGSELVLDVGCGRGLMLVGAAKRLTSGKAIGIDLWQQQDQSDNSATAASENAEIEGVLDRIEIQTADMRQLPFPDNHFDVVVSSWAVHNVEDGEDSAQEKLRQRQKALDEIVRVLKPRGMVILADIVNQAEYAKYFERCDMQEIRLHNRPVRDAILQTVTFGTFAPSAVSACKGS